MQTTFLLIQLPTFIYFIINFLSPKAGSDSSECRQSAMQTNTNIESGTSCHKFFAGLHVDK